MTVIAMLVPLLSPAVPVLAIALILWLATRRRPDVSDTVADAARRHEVLVSTLSAAAAVVIAVILLWQPGAWLARTVTTGTLQAITPLVIATAFASVRALGELTWPRPHGDVRSAPLTRRTVWSLGGLRLKSALGTGFLLVAGLIATGVTADASGRGFVLQRSLGDGGSILTTAGPYPGWPSGGPVLVALALTTVATWLALVAIVRRRPLTGVPTVHDDALRHTSAHRILGGVQLCLGFTVYATWWTAGSAIANAVDGVPSRHPVLGVLAIALQAIAGCVVAGSTMAALASLWPRPVPRAEPAAPATSTGRAA